MSGGEQPRMYPLTLFNRVGYHECAARSSWKSSFLLGTDDHGWR